MSWGRPFVLHRQAPILVAPQSLWLKACRSPKTCRPTSQLTSMQHFKMPIAPSKTHRSWASQPGPWSYHISVRRKDFYSGLFVYGFFFFFCFSFCLGLYRSNVATSSPSSSLVYALSVMHLTTIQQDLYISDTISPRRLSACGPVASRNASTFVSISFNPRLCVLYNTCLYCLRLAYIIPCAWPRQRQTSVAPALPFLLFSCAFSLARPSDNEPSLSCINRFSGLVISCVYFAGHSYPPYWPPDALPPPTAVNFAISQQFAFVKRCVAIS